MTTTVVNIRDLPKNWEQDPTYFRVDRKTDWGNPFVIPRDGDRAQVIAMYKSWALFNLIRADVIPLKGKTLACWCKPLACHGELLAAWADKYG